MSDLKLQTVSRLEANVQSAIKLALDQIKQDIEEKAVAEFRERIKREIGNVAVMLANYYSVERMGPDLVIRVRIEEPNPPPS